MTATKENNISYFKLLKYLLPQIGKAAPGWTAADCIIMAASSSFQGLTTIMMAMIFDSVEGAVAGTVGFWSAVMVIAATAGVQVVHELLNGICNFLAMPASMKITGVFHRKIHGKITKLPAIAFDDPETLDCINKAKQGAQCTVWLYHSVSTLLMFYIPYFIVMGAFLYSLRPILLLAIVFVFIPHMLAQIVKSGAFSKLADEAAPLNRKMEYYENEMYQRNFYKETRILGTFSFVKKLYLETLDIFCDKTWKAEKKTQLVEISLRIVMLLGYVGVLWLLLDSLLRQYITVGAFAAVFASVDLMFGCMEDAVKNYLGGMFANSGHLRNYIKFFNLPEDTGAVKDLNYNSGISIKNASFKYPGSTKNVVDNVSLDIKPGETIAFVGENGAGKTTFVRLITGILKPSNGVIEVGGIPTDSLSKRSLFGKVSGVFQNYQRYRMTLCENVNISNRFIELDSSKLSVAVEQSDIILDETYTDGMDTMLSREFDGIDLSGGQWQRVALARGLYKDSSLIILDEPTSAIDPIEETKLYKKFKEISKGKIAVIVTHRLGSAKIADRIIVFGKGKIQETGTHDELISIDGIYAQMYRSQAKWYEDGNGGKTNEL